MMRMIVMEESSIIIDRSLKVVEHCYLNYLLYHTYSHDECECATQMATIQQYVLPVSQ